ncbi:MAG TPA: trypsin-like peptidase domain-containing protein [Dehalococcoidia bacterium]|nr:trypsin-like peptidase domain-containing protein [Dehalococcoidia bacterium]
MRVTSAAEQLLFTTVRLTAQVSKTVERTGTAFFFVHNKDEKNFPFIVSNKHVVKDAKRGIFLFNRSDGNHPLLGQGFQILVDNFYPQWFGHPDDDVDLSIMPFAPVIRLLEEKQLHAFFRTISSATIPDEEQVESLDAIENVLMVGYPLGLYDKVNLTPVVRTGITATPVGLDYNGKAQFLIDAAVFPGSSGSPVVLLNSGGYYDKGGSLNLGTNRFHLLGVLAEVLTMSDTGKIEVREIPTKQEPVVQIATRLNLGVVWKSQLITETVEAFLKQRGGV